jgi:phosphopantothenoylcysteine decarboxylase/phosphopantothenate--cysteine ligase
MANFLISAGPTIEKIDAVRFISNHSSGKMGYAMATAAVAAGNKVTLVSGPTRLTPPAGVDFVAVESAAEMAAAIHQRATSADFIIMVAAVADYRPVQTVSGKIKKSPGNITMELERTEDILLTLGQHKQPGQKLIGFAAETDNVLEYAREKLKSKNLDWIIANDVSRKDRGFGADNNAVTMIAANGEVVELPLTDKLLLAGRIIEIITGTK